MATDIAKRNNVRITGNGKQTIMLAHGFGCDQHTWRYIIEAFKNDYRLVVFDYVGAGQSDLLAYNTERYSTLNGYAQDVVEICEALHLQNIIFIGHSVSAMIGVLASAKNPSLFSKLVFIGPSPRYLNDGDYTGGMEPADLDALFQVMDNNYLGWAGQMAPKIMNTPEQPELGEDLANSFCATDPDIAKQFARVTFSSDNRADLATLTIPSLTLQCTNDMLAPEEVGRYINKITPNNTLHYLKAAGHCPHLSAPGEVISAIKQFI